MPRFPEIFAAACSDFGVLSEQKSIPLSLIVFVLKLGINLGKDRVRAEGEMIRDQDLLGISSSDEL
jgi:hypothetical protein